MLRVRRLLPGEERTYNDAADIETINGWTYLRQKEGKDGRWFWDAIVSSDGSTIIENCRPCSVRFSDGSREAMIQALDEITETSRVREARAIARRTLREAGR